MYHKHHTKGIILGGTGEGDYSRRVAVLTESFGLIYGKVQGARMLKSRLRSGVQDFTYGEFSLVHGKVGWRVVSTRVEKNFFELLKNSPSKLAILGNTLRLVRKLVAGEEPDAPLFQIITGFLERLPAMEERLVQMAECMVLMKILHTLGYMRHDPEFLENFQTINLTQEDLENLLPKRVKMIKLINESLKATQILS